MFLISPSLLTTYRPRKPVAPNTVAAIPLEEERPPFPLGMTASCSFLCWTVGTVAADNTAVEQLPIERTETQVKFNQHPAFSVWSNCLKLLVWELSSKKWVNLSIYRYYLMNLCQHRAKSHSNVSKILWTQWREEMELTWGCLVLI